MTAPARLDLAPGVAHHLAAAFALGLLSIAVALAALTDPTNWAYLAINTALIVPGLALSIDAVRRQYRHITHPTK